MEQCQVQRSGAGSATCIVVFFFQAEDGIRDDLVTGVQTCALPISTGLSAWTGPIAAPATPEAPLVLGRGNHQAPAGHASVVGTRLVVATDSLLDHRIARQHWAPRRRSDLSNGRRCSLRLRSSPTLYP